MTRLLASAAKLGRFRPVSEEQNADDAQPPTDVENHDIGRMVKRGAVWAFGSQVAGQVIRFVSVIVLARLLTPSDYGAASIAIALGSFSVLLGDLGFGTALVQAKDATQRRASTAYWAALVSGVGVTAVAALGAYPAALVLGEPQVTALVIVGGLTFFLVALGSTSNALLTRSMSFGVIQSATLAAWLAAAACGITAAALGAGAWALVVQQVVLAGVTAALFILAARWRPSFEFSGDAFRSLSRFALPVTGGSVFGVIQPLLSALLIGSLLSVHELGIWSLAMSVVVLPASLFSYPIARVMYAAFARLRDTPERIAGTWVNGFTTLAAIALPALFGLIAVAPDVVPLAFGPQWDGAVPVVQILAVFLMVRTLQTWNTPVMDAFGKPHVAMLINLATLIVLVPGIWIGSSFGIEGVAVAFSVASFVAGELPSFIITTRALKLNALRVVGRLGGILLSSAVMCVTVALLRRALEDAGIGVELRVLLEGAAGALVYLGCLTLSARGIARELFGMARGLGPALRTAR